MLLQLLLYNVVLASTARNMNQPYIYGRLKDRLKHGEILIVIQSCKFIISHFCRSSHTGFTGLKSRYGQGSIYSIFLDRRPLTPRCTPNRNKCIYEQKDIQECVVALLVISISWK